MQTKLVLFLAVCAVYMLCYVSAAGENMCCVDQPAPIVRVEKAGRRTMYRHATRQTRYNTGCGFLGWGRCTRYRSVTFAQSYEVDIYQQNSYPQPCRKYQCCHGFVMVKDICYTQKELNTAVGHVADIKDGLQHIGDVGLGDAIDVIHDIVG